MNKLKALQLKMSEKNNSKSESVLYVNKIKDSIKIRFLPDIPELNGVFYFETQYYYLPRHRRPITSAKTFGIKCPIQSIIDEAKQSDDSTIVKMASELKLRRDYRFPVILLNQDNKIIDANGDLMPETGKVNISDYVTILACPKEVINQMLNLILHPDYRDDNGDSVLFDRVHGCNLTIKKSGTGLNTSYMVTPDRKPTIMPEFFYDLETMPNVIAHTAKHVAHPDYVNALIVNEIYDIDIPEEVKNMPYDVLTIYRGGTAVKDEVKAAVSKQNSYSKVEPADSDDIPFDTSEKIIKPSAKKPSNVNIGDDFDDLD